MDINSNSNGIVLVVIILLIVLATVLIYREMTRANATTNSVIDSEEISDPDPSDVPPESAYQPFTIAPDFSYVYYPDQSIYLLPFDYLDFTNPYHRWMYFYYPGFYSSYYDNVWPYSYPRNYYNRWWRDRRYRRNRFDRSDRDRSYRRNRFDRSRSRSRSPRINTRTYPNRSTGFAGGRNSQRFSRSPQSGRAAARAMSRSTSRSPSRSFGGRSPSRSFGGRSGGRSAGRSGGRRERFDDVANVPVNTSSAVAMTNINQEMRTAPADPNRMISSEKPTDISPINNEMRTAPDSAASDFNLIKIDMATERQPDIIQGTFIPSGANPIGSIPGTLILQRGMRSSEMPKVNTLTRSYDPTMQYVNDFDAMKRSAMSDPKVNLTEKFNNLVVRTKNNGYDSEFVGLSNPKKFGCDYTGYELLNN